MQLMYLSNIIYLFSILQKKKKQNVKLLTCKIVPWLHFFSGNETGIEVSKFM